MKTTNLRIFCTLTPQRFWEVARLTTRQNVVKQNISILILILAFLNVIVTAPILFSLTVSAEEISHHILISKSKRQLSVISGTGAIIKTYSIASGRGGPGDKYRLGDQKTPIGVYKVVGFKSNSDFFYFIRLNYPNENDARRGFRDRLINRIQYDAILEALDNDLTPPQDTRLGGAIGIHGIGEESESKISMHNSLDWTQGCIALRNHEVEDLLAFLSVGIHVVIKD